MSANNYDAGQTGIELIVAKLEKLARQTNALEAKMENVLSETQERALDREAIFQKITAENKELLQELKYISAQQTSIYRGMDKSMNAISGKMDGVKGVPAASDETDLDALAEKVAERLKLAQREIDYDVLAERVAQRINRAPEIDYDELGFKVVQNMYIPSAIVEDIDYDALAQKLKERPDEVISPDYIASRVAEQIAYPAIDEETVARNVAERIAVPAAAADEEAIARAVADKLNVDGREIADIVAKQLGSIAPDRFDITVDEDGCDTLARAIADKLDTDAVAAAVAERISATLLPEEAKVDVEELAKQLSEKIQLSAKLDEEALADKAAAVLSNYISDIDTDEVADKVVAGVIPALPAQPEVNAEAIAEDVASRVAEKQGEQDFDIVLDEEGLQNVSEAVAEKIKGEYIERFDKVDAEIEELKKLLAAGAAIAAAAELAPVAAEEAEEEELVTVSGIVDEEADGETAGKVITEEVDAEVFDEVDEQPAEAELTEDALDEPAEINVRGGVDFLSMMKYNRSFIARIIQSTDEQKQYYGQVKNALLSYKKVNSNIAWGAERFNKGRETIARFKIRGKTLCLYLALDPNEFATSVYHHADVSDNKSMSGTPMMVKIKSPLGVKKAIRLIDAMLEKRQGIKQKVAERDYAAMYPYETMEELIDDGLVKDVSKK